MIRLPYLTAVTQETLRIHPVAMLTFPRRAEVPVEICGHALSVGEIVIGSIYMLHQNEDLYPEPDRFRPERFLERQYSPYEFMPFGAGVRRCVGMALAQYEMKIVLGTIVRELNLSLRNETAVKQARRGVTLGHAGEIRIRNEGRRLITAGRKPASMAVT
jgi:cytochrome P450